MPRWRKLLLATSAVWLLACFAYLLATESPDVFMARAGRGVWLVIAANGFANAVLVWEVLSFTSQRAAQWLRVSYWGCIVALWVAFFALAGTVVVVARPTSR